jgi:NADP-dependent 3-hydroxy acid dehydrogenase YdfG
MPSIAVFGAGPALGLSVARRFAAERYAVALVARDPAKLSGLERTLAAGGATVAAFPADLADRAQAGAAAAALRERFGLPDAVVYSPGDVSRLPVGALALDAEQLDTWLPLHLLTPLALFASLLPGMLERGSGALIAVQGTAAREPQAELASVGAAQAALRNWIHAAAPPARERGVRLATVAVGGLIERSAAAALFARGHFDEITDGQFPRRDPDELAERIWRLTTAAGDALEVTA